MPTANLIYVPYDSGHRAWRMGRGPLHIQEHRPAVANVDVRETLVELPGEVHPELRTAFDLQRLVADAVATARGQGQFPCVIAGNCNVGAIGAVAGVKSSEVGLLWFDAHDDCETPETTTSGFVDGMGLAILTGQCFAKLLSTITHTQPLRGDRVVLLGARDVSPGASQNLARAGIQRLSVDALRGTQALSEALLRLRAHGVRQLVIHIDLDVLDPDAIAPANSYAVQHGLFVDEVVQIIRQAHEHCEIVSASIASFDPACDVNHKMLGTAVALMREIVDRPSATSSSG